MSFDSAVFETNRAALLKKCPGLQEISLCPAGHEAAAYAGLTFFQARSGVLTAKWQETNIHSAFDPRREAEKLVTSECEADMSLCIFYGCGLGYYLKAFVERFPRIPVVVIEPDLPFFLNICNRIDFQSLFTPAHIFWFFKNDPEELTPLLNTLPMQKVKVITLRSLFAKDEAYYRKADKVIQSVVARQEINLNTLKRFGKLWVRNLLKNMFMLARVSGLAALEQLFQNLPALVLAAGPTLDRLLPHLPELHQRFLLITVDTSLKACLNRGVAPDFVVVVDPQYWNTRHLDGIDKNPGHLALLEERTLLLSESSTHPAVFKRLPVPVYFGSSFFPLGQYFEAIVGLKGKLGAGGSVATAAWDFARLLGAVPIFMAGLDLGYPERATHFKGAFFENLFHAQSTHLHPASSLAFSYIMQAEPFYTASNATGPVLTDIRMQVYRSWFQTQLTVFRTDCPTYNLSPTGVKIEGMPYKSHEELLHYPVIRPEIEHVMQGIQTAYRRQPEVPCQDEPLVQALSELKEDFFALSALADQGLAECQKIRTALAKGLDVRTGLDRLSKLDNELLQHSARQIAGFLLQPLIHETLQARPADATFEQVMTITERFYDEIANSARYHLELLTCSLEQMTATH